MEVRDPSLVVKTTPMLCRVFHTGAAERSPVAGGEASLEASTFLPAAASS
jgi:hypothetical protein